MISENPYQLNNANYFNKLKHLVQSYPRAYFNIIKSNKYKQIFQPILKWIDEQLPKLTSDVYLISTKVNWILTGRIDFPTCEICGKYLYIGKNIQVFSQYGKYCQKCRKKINGEKSKQTFKQHQLDDPCWYETIDAKRKQTCIERYNDPTYNNVAKNTQTCIYRYGVDNVRKTDHCKRKIKTTKLQRYGNENYVNVDKAKMTNQLNHGVDWPMQSHDIRKKAAKGYVYDKQIFDSKGELCYYIWLRDNNIQFTYQPKVSFMYECNGESHKYFPDFLVEGQYVELKGNHFFKDDGTMQNPYDHSLDYVYEAKHQCMIKNNVRILKHDDYIKYIDYVIKAYGKQFILKCKDDYETLKQ